MDRAQLRQTIGKVLMVGIPGTDLDAVTAERLRRLQVGAVILFRRNIGSIAALVALSRRLHALPSAPLVTIDHEGGRVLRVGAPFTQFPPMAVVGATRDVELAFQIGRAMGIELAAVGVDVNFAPVLDVHSNPTNPVIGDRAFSHDPATVSAMGIALMRGLQAGGVLACGKHFPGHGDTDSDSHLELPVVRRDRATLDQTELIPFSDAIAADIPMLMTAHVLYPALDALRPATLSPVILRQLLRDEMGFDGVVVSDDLDMRAISDHHDVGTTAVATLAAGVDLLSFCADLSKAEIAADAIERAVVDGTLDTNVLQSAADRMARLARPIPITTAVAELPYPEHARLLGRISTARAGRT